MIDLMPEPPDPDDPVNYTAKGAAFMVAMRASGPQWNAAIASINAIASGSAQSISYQFSDNTAMADPAPGFVRLNQAVQNTATQMALDLTDLVGDDRTGTINTFGASTSLIKGYLVGVKQGDPTKWMGWAITGLSSPAGFKLLDVVFVDGTTGDASPFTNGNTILLKFTRNGDAGPPGTTVTYPWFGDGSDGDVTISSGTTTLTRNMYYNNLTINGTGSLDPAGYQIYVADTLDLTAAPAGAIKRTANPGGNAVATTAGAAPAAMAEASAGGSGQGLIGKTGITGNGAGTASTLAVKTAQMHGGRSGATHAAGSNGGGNAGGAGAAKPTAVQTAISLAIAAFIFAAPGLLAQGGVHGAGGPSGGSGGSATSGAGGGGADGGGVIDVRARYIDRGAGTAAGAIQAKGGIGGNGGDATSSGGAAGGGSGGAGGGGGFVQIIYEALLGTLAANCVDVSGGKGGDGGVKVSTGVDGAGADGGDGGAYRTFNVTTSTTVHNISAVTGSANVGTVGGAGAVQQYNL